MVIFCRKTLLALSVRRLYYGRPKTPTDLIEQSFPAAGAEPYKRDLKTLEYHLLDAGHFALETDGDTIARLMREFLVKHAAKK